MSRSLTIFMLCAALAGMARAETKAVDGWVRGTVPQQQASGAFMRNMGLGRRYVDGKLGMTFVLEAHVTYDREVKEGDPLRITTQILDHDAKRIHYIHEMHHAAEGYLAATNELMLMNIDYETRRSAPWPDFAMERIEKLAAAHAGLPRPAQAGRLIGIKRK